MNLHFQPPGTRRPVNLHLKMRKTTSSKSDSPGFHHPNFLRPEPQQHRALIASAQRIALAASHPETLRNTKNSYCETRSFDSLPGAVGAYSLETQGVTNYGQR